MDQFISTYQKDYTWPSTKIQHAPALLREGGPCRCDERSRVLKVIELCGDDQDWSRIGPMGRLLDPKLYPAKTGPHPETEVTKFDQPSTYMRKLEQKYPNLYGILQNTPMDEIIQRVDRDRLITTYQMDYGDKAITGTEDAEIDPCVSIKQPLKIDCRPFTRSRHPKRDAGQKSETKTSRKKVEEDTQETRLPPWRSEYQDNISRLGHAIMRSKIHHKKAAGPAWSMALL
ncbi:uncharacterized protein LOC128891268 [Hylaeus anthracinus]|uniref:uncharacterized protein LOC128891268 n=1 Tax=Hylaeus anthracinus TaxID=313031 RepID=UPI0023B956FC|nr:uncharacterized protein LOC128891268 [Hylaeus anthracinus]